MSRRYLIFFLCIVALASACRMGASSPAPETVLPADSTGTITKTADSIIYASGLLGRMRIVLPDSSQAILNPATFVRAPKTFGSGERRVILDGDACFETSVKQPGAFVIQTRNLLLETKEEGPAILRVSAFARDEGESAQVRRGRIIVRKSYPSPDHTPDTLGPGNMIMINRRIDLMEKETFDSVALVAWQSGVLNFHDEPSDSVLRDLEEWFGVTIEMAGTPPAGARVSMRMQGDRLDRVLDNLAPMAPRRYTIGRYKVTLEY